MGLGGLGFIVLSLLLWSHNVPTQVTEGDKIAITKMMDGVKDIDLKSFEEQVQFIRSIQRAVLDSSPEFIKIPNGQTREPNDLLSSGHGQCGDRGRTIEKALRFYGFEVRFFSVFSGDQTYIPDYILNDGSGKTTRSHALVEVKTSKGWMIVDTNEEWLSLDKKGDPLSIKAWKNTPNKESFEWHRDNKGQVYWILLGRFNIYYGLYSRHGRFYPPFTPYVPDINVQTMVKGYLH